MENRLFIWTTNRAKDPGACQYYRINTPLSQLEKMGYAYGYEDQGQNGQNDLKAMFTSDVCQFYSIGGEAPLHQIKTLKDIKPGTLPGGEYQYPPICVYDVDDNTDFVHPMNSTYCFLGLRHYPSGKFLTPGQALEWEDDTGERKMLWEDLVTEAQGGVFDIERNLHQMKIRHELIRTCHGATVSTPALASYFKEVIKQPNIHVFPNTIVPEDYEHFEVKRENPNEVRVLWQGSPSHYVDWFPLQEAIKTITNKYPQVKWVIYGEYFQWVKRGLIPAERIEYHPWSHYKAYMLRRGLLNIDINLCPLANNGFNRCKSAIKWYEASIWKNPEATLAANVEPYHEIEEGVTGLLYNNPDEFVEKFSALIENAELRKTLGYNSKKWVLKNRTPEVTIPPLAEFYQELKDRQRRELTPRIIVATR